MALNIIEAKTTKTAAFTASTGLDISGLSAADFNHLCVRVSNLQPTSGAGPQKAMLGVQYVAAADFTTPSHAQSFNVKGNIGPANEVVMSIPRRELPSLPVGVANGKVRVILESIDANSTITYDAWLE